MRWGIDLDQTLVEPSPGTALGVVELPRIELLSLPIAGDQREAPCAHEALSVPGMWDGRL
jgi:hypothetical protein